MTSQTRKHHTLATWLDARARVITEEIRKGTRPTTASVSPFWRLEWSMRGSARPTPGNPTTARSERRMNELLAKDLRRAFRELGQRPPIDLTARAIAAIRHTVDSVHDRHIPVPPSYWNAVQQGRAARQLVDARQPAPNGEIGRSR